MNYHNRKFLLFINISLQHLDNELGDHKTYKAKKSLLQRSTSTSRQSTRLVLKTQNLKTNQY
jgi:hypothetical protein